MTAPEPTPLQQAAEANYLSRCGWDPRAKANWDAMPQVHESWREATRPVLDAGLAGDWLERVLGEHVLLRVAVAPGRNGWACACGNRYAQESRQGASRPDGAHAAHQAAAIRAAAGVGL